MRWRDRLVEIAQIAGILAWLMGASAGILLTRNQPNGWREMFVHSFIIPILFTSFFYGRLGGLLVALVASLVSGSLIMDEPGSLESPLIQRVMFQIIFFNVVALVTSVLSEREKEAKTSYRSLFENMPIGLYRTTPGGRIVDANPALVQMLGYPNRESLLAAQVSDVYVTPEVHEQWQDMVKREGTVRNFEIEARRRDGTVIWLRNNNQAFRDDEGRVLYHEGVLEDVTERVRTERKLAAIHALGREMVLTSDVQQIASAVMDAARQVLEFGVCDLWLVDREHNALIRQAPAGTPASDVRSLPLNGTRGITVAVVQGGEPIYLAEVTTDPRYISSNPTARSELCVPLKVGEQVIGVLNTESERPDAFTVADQHLFQILAHVTAVALENARLHQTMTSQTVLLEEQVAARTAELSARVAEAEQFNRSMVDLMEELQAANRLARETAWQLEEANAELESFSYSVSHDLRAPLRAMDGFSRILLEEHVPQLSPPIARYLRIIRENAQQMGQLIDDLLTFSRLSRQPIKEQSIVLTDLVHQAIRDLAYEQGGRRVDISVGDLADCRGDPALLKQVFVNLLANALKFTRDRDESRIEVGCQQGPDGRVVYLVRDNGVGFDMRYTGKLFGVFQRLHRDDDYEGTGVGLAIVQRIVRRHGGRVWAEAQVDQGATFYFTLGPASEILAH